MLEKIALRRTWGKKQKEGREVGGDQSKSWGSNWTQTEARGLREIFAYLPKESFRHPTLFRPPSCLAHCSGFFPMNFREISISWLPDVLSSFLRLYRKLESESGTQDKLKLYIYLKSIISPLYLWTISCTNIKGVI